MNSSRWIKEAAVKHCGTIFTGKRHHNAIRVAVDTTGVRPVQAKDQGFITNLGEFVTREEAAVIAFKAGQIKELKDELYSEDLY